VSDETWRLKCDDCDYDDGTVEETVCPYAYEMYGEEIPANLCDSCAYNRHQEI